MVIDLRGSEEDTGEAGGLYGVVCDRSGVRSTVIERPCNLGGVGDWVVGPDTTLIGASPLSELGGRDLSNDARAGGGNKVVCEAFRGFIISTCGLLGGLLGNGGLPSPVSCGVITPRLLVFSS